MITRMKDTENGNICDFCCGCIADCCGNVQFNEINPSSDNIIACDDFHGDFDPEIMIQSEGELE